MENPSIDYIKYDYNAILTASKSKSYREGITAQSVILMKFLKDNNLLLIEPFEKEGVLKSDLVVRDSNLTEEGRELFRSAAPKWWNYLDRGGKLENISHLEKGLALIRAKMEKPS